MGQVLGIVYRVIATRLIKKAGLAHKQAHTGAVTLIRCLECAILPQPFADRGRIKALDQNVPLFPKANHLAGCGDFIKMFRFGSTIRFLAQSGTSAGRPTDVAIRRQAEVS